MHSGKAHKRLTRELLAKEFRQIHEFMDVPANFLEKRQRMLLHGEEISGIAVLKDQDVGSLLNITQGRIDSRLKRLLK